MIQTQVILDLAAADRGALPLVGGKGANLGALLGAGFAVPPGFCLTTAAYQEFTAPAADMIAAALAQLDVDNAEQLEQTSRAIRAHLESLPVPAELQAAIREAYSRLAETSTIQGLATNEMTAPPVAVRSSATAEDLPDASFAGQQDTFLNIRGPDALIDAVTRCWSSLWTSRAIAYRARNGFAHDEVALSVVVQLMVDADVAGVLFTADPVSGNRRRMLVNGAWGLGEAIVSGSVSPDTWTIDDEGAVLETEIGHKTVMVRYAPDGGTVELPVPAAQERAPSLDAGRLRELAELGRKAQAFFGAPQDIEWALAGGRIWLLQSRPITTLFPLPEPRPLDDELHVYLSFNNLQGMLEPITPMGIAIFGELGRTLQAYLGVHVFPAGKAPAFVSGADRLWFDATQLLRSPRARRVLLAAFGIMDPQSGDAVREMLQDPRLTPKALLHGAERNALVRKMRPALIGGIKRIAGNVAFPERAVWRVEHEFRPRLLATLERAERAQTLSERVMMIGVLFRGALPLMGLYVPPAFVPGLVSGALVDRLVRRWGLPDDKLVQLRQGLPHNPTTEMDLALWDVSRTIVGDAAARAVFGEHDAAELTRRYQAGTLPRAAQAALGHFLERYGHRAVREIDIGMPRWADDPSYIVDLVRGYVQMSDPSHAPDRHFRELQLGALSEAERLIAAARRQRGGVVKARLLRFLIRRLRTLAGLREGPKFWAIRVFRAVRSQLLGCGAILVERGQLERADDIFFLTLDELRAIDAGDAEPKQALVAARRRSYTAELERHLVPRVVTSEGRVIYGRKGSLEDGMLGGVGVSPGTATGRARIIRDPHGAQLQPGEILVAPSTDPAWTPLFLTAGGLVMEAGGVLSHGSVVAREYGIPAVVAVAGATTTLREGQLIRVDGGAGTVELVSEDAG